MTKTADPKPPAQIRDDPEAREERRAVYRGMIQHENDLRNQRLGWLFALNGFLFAAVGVVWTTSKPEPLLRTLAATGVVASLSCWVALWFGTKGIRTLTKRAEDEEKGDDLPVVAMRTADLWDGMPTVVEWAIRVVYPWNLVPWALAAAWVVIFFVVPGHS